MAAPPVLLFPCRLETHLDQHDPNYELLVRIFPDDVHVDTHEPALTPDERLWGTAFWTAPAADQPAAWNQLADRYGEPRAAYIVFSTHRGASDPGTRAESWTLPPHARILPRFWTAYLYDAGGRPLRSLTGGPVTGHSLDIQANLPIGPDPSPTAVRSGTPPVDDGMRWMIDFSRAEAAGMGLRIPLSAAQRAQLDAVLVVGWDDRMAPTDGAAQIERQLQVHHWTDGLGLVPAATPTSNTATVDSGHVRKPSDHSASYAVEFGPDLTTEQTDGAWLADALGVHRAVFAHVPHADGMQQRDAAAMNTALWRLTYGYFLEKMMAGAYDFDDSKADGARRHFIDNVRPAGPLPVLRIGHQPYGVLPAMSLSGWQSLEGDVVDSLLVDIIGRALPIWVQSVAGAPRITGASSSADQDLVSILGMDAVDTDLAGRFVLGPGYFDYLFQFMLGSRLTGWWQQQQGLVDHSITALHLPHDPMLSRAVFAPKSFGLTEPAVIGGGADPSSPLPAALNYLTWIATGASGYQEIRSRPHFVSPAPATPQPGDGTRTPVFYRLLRHSALLEYAAAAYRGQAIPPANRAEPELVNISPLGEDRTATVWDVLARPMPGSTRSAGHDLDGLRRSGGPDGAFMEFWQRVGTLASRPVADLEFALRGALDTASYRLDAWITSMATKRLRGMRGMGAGRVEGTLVGGYGWVERLSNQPIARPTGGYVHAPSLDQARAAAVLRSGYLGHRDAGDGDRFAMDLESSRVRTARWLLDGAREQPLGALLGYRFERSLHEMKLDQYIEAFRTLAPLGATPAPATAAAFDSATRAAATAQIKAQDAHARAQRAADTARQAALAAEGPQRDVQRLQTQTGELERRVMTARRDPAAIAESAAAQAQLAVARTTLAQLMQGAQAAAAAADRALAEAATADAEAAAAVSAVRTAGDAAAAADAEYRRKLELTAGHSVPAGGQAAAVAGITAVAASQVVDGLALDRLFKRNGIPFGSGTFPPAGSADHAGLLVALRALDNIVDATADAILAEAVYHVVRGNPMRAGASVDAVARGEVAPPELEAQRTPRTGAAHEQRVIVLLRGASTTPLEDTGRRAPAVARQARAAAEPRLDAWAATLLPAPHDVRIRVRYLERPPSTTATPREFTLDQLDLAPIDLVFLAEPTGPVIGAELAARIRVFADENRPSGVAATAVVEVVGGRDPGWPVAAIAIDEVMYVARRLRILTNAARPLEPADLASPGGQPGALDDADLQLRADHALASLQAIAADLAAASNLPDALLRAWHFGVRNVLPGPGEHVDEKAAAGRAAIEIARRLDEHARVVSGFDRRAATPAARVDHDAARLTALFGAGFRPLPCFIPTQSNDLAASLGNTTAFLDNDPVAGTTWLLRQSRVHPGADRLRQAIACAAALTRTAPARVLVGQLPYAPGDRWSGLSGPPAPGGRIGFVVQAQGIPTGGTSVCGLFVDQMVETVPNASETTGVTFHLDEPNARAPQVILLAVPADAAAWTTDKLAATVTETMQLARIRVVDPDVLRSAGQLLPALYLAVNMGQETISTDLTGLDVEPAPFPLRKMRLTVNQPSLPTGRVIQGVVVTAVDADGGALVDAALKIDGVGAKTSGVAFDLGPIITTPPQGSASAPGFADQPIPWPAVVQSTLSLEASPAPLRADVAVALTILATDAATGQPVAGTVRLSNFEANAWVVHQFATNKPFNTTLHLQRRAGRPPVFVSPWVIVSASGYPEARLDLFEGGDGG